MRLANVDGRAVLLTGDGHGVDVAVASDGKYGPGLPSVYADWDGFRAWAEDSAEGAAATDTPVVFTRDQLGSPSPDPRQIVAVGLNYSAHARESGFAEPDDLPPVFTKFVSSMTGPDTTVVLPSGGRTDWEVELVLVIGRTAHRVAAGSAWDHVAGLSIGQDISERVSQLAGPAPQFSLAKSFPGFTPVGPWLVTPEEVTNRDDLALGCAVDGETVQESRTKDLIFPVPQLISGLSRALTLYPGDVIFTGTPAGVGVGRDPQRFLSAGAKLHSWIEGIGDLYQTFVDEEV